MRRHTRDPVLTPEVGGMRFISRRNHRFRKQEMMNKQAEKKQPQADIAPRLEVSSKTPRGTD
jgi:hypothetical protein